MSKLKKFIFNKLTRYKALIFLILSNLGFSILGFWEDIIPSKGRWFLTVEGWGFIIPAVFFVLGAIDEFQQATRSSDLEKKIKNLEKQISNQADPIVISGILTQLLSKMLDFGATERITVFKYIQNRSHFVPVGRYSANPNYNKRFREHYEIDTGCLGEAWANGSCDTATLPSYETEQDEYRKICKDRWKLTFTLTEKLTMKSRRYYGIRIEDSGIPSVPVGVIVFETLEETFPNSATGSTIGGNLKESHFNDLFTWIIQQSPSSASYIEREPEDE